MNVFVDTSAILAVLDSADLQHAKAKRIWFDLIKNEDSLVSTSYVLVETFALLQNRFGLEAVEIFERDIEPIITLEWVNEELHRAGAAKVLASGRKKLSLVDCVSFEAMRRLGVKHAFTFDKHFREQGFVAL